MGDTPTRLSPECRLSACDDCMDCPNIRCDQCLGCGCPCHNDEEEDRG